MMTDGDDPQATPLGIVLGASIFFPLAGGYFLSFFYRSINAMIAPDLINELGLSPAELGLMTAAYFLGFGLFQFPLGILLDRFGPARVQSSLLAVAAVGALLFSTGETVLSLSLGRGLIGVGVAGALGLTISSSDTRASLATGSTVNLADGTDGNTTAGELKISADEDGRNVARSEPTVSGGKFGLGASVAVITPTRGTTAEIEDQAVINGANDVTVMATSELETESYAKAGVDGGVALSPVVAVTLVDSLTLARVGARTGPEPNDPNNADGAPQINTAITGNLTITSDHSGDSESIADGSVESTGAAIGAGVAITITEDTQEARLDRSFTTGGNITVDASGFHDDSAIAKATAAGASDDSTTTVSETTTKIVEHTETFQPPPREVEVPPAPNAFVTYFDTARPKLKGNGNDQ